MGHLSTEPSGDQEYASRRVGPERRHWRVIEEFVAVFVFAEGGVRGTTAQNLIRESWFGFSLNPSYRDLLYSGGGKYD